MRIFVGMCVFLFAGVLAASAFAQAEYSAVANQPAPVFAQTGPYHFAGKEIQLDLQVGRPGQEVQKLFGITGVLHFTGTQYLDYVEGSFASGSFLGSDLITLPPRVDDIAGEITFAITRKSGAGGVSGSGVVASLQLVSSPATPDSLPVTLSLRNMAAIDSAGNRIELAPEDLKIYLVQPRDFALDVVPDSADVIRGDSVTFAVNVSQANLFEQPVALAIEPAFAGITPVWSAQTILPGSAATLRLVTTENTPTGVYDFTISGTSDTLTHNASIRLIVNEKPDFTLRVEPQTRKITAGQPADFSISIVPNASFAAAVRLTFMGPPSTAIQAQISPETIDANTQSSLNVQTTVEAAPGNYPFTVVAQGGGLTRSAAVSLIIGFDFEVRIEPKARTLFPGDSASFSISVAYAGNVAEKARLEISGLASFGWLQSDFSPTLIGRDETANLLLKTSLAADVGEYPFTATATIDTLSRDATASLIVTDRPARVMPSPFTPNHDGANDAVKFYHKELQTGAGEILIFDLNGRKIRHLRNKRKWNGKDNNGNDARPGAYLFLVLVDGKMIDKGAIALIR